MIRTATARGAGPESPHEPLCLAVPAMGTRFELVIEDAIPQRTDWPAIAEEALDLVREWHDRLNRFDKRSLVSHINAHAHARPIRVDTEAMRLLEACREFHGATGGAFDPALGGFADVVLDPARSTVGFVREGVRLDFGAIAKGFVLDLCARGLREAGVTAALVHGGTSSVVAVGAPRGADAWTIGVRLGAGLTPVRVALADGALSVSAAQLRPDADDRRAHVVDPETGRPVPVSSAACVVGDGAGECDAWSTALLVLGARPGAMPAHLTSVVPDEAGEHGWRAEGKQSHRIRALSKEAHDERR